MLGLVLSGGESKRMGTDKGLIKPDGQDLVWAASAKTKLSSLGIPVVISVNETQFFSYHHFFSADTLVTDDSNLSLKGPLCGILSVHKLYPQEDIFVLACDMPLMEKFLLEELVTAQALKPDADAFIYSNQGQPEPLCAIYTARGLKYIMQLYLNGKLIKHSMKYMLEQLSCIRIPVVESYEKHFQNFNAHASLNGL